MNFQDAIASLKQKLALKESSRLGREVLLGDIQLRDVQEAIRSGRITTGISVYDFCIARYGQGANDSTRDNLLILFHKSVRCLGQPILLVERELVVLAGACWAKKTESREHKLVINLSLGDLEDVFVYNARENLCGFPVKKSSSLADLSSDGRTERKIFGQIGPRLLYPQGRDLGLDLGKPLPLKELGIVEILEEPVLMLEALVGFSEIQEWTQKYPQLLPSVKKACLFLGFLPKGLI